jgi:hypothetical protein
VCAFNYWCASFSLAMSSLSVNSPGPRMMEWPAVRVGALKFDFVNEETNPPLDF